jgi:hypothetical protein
VTDPRYIRVFSPGQPRVVRQLIRGPQGPPGAIGNLFAVTVGAIALLTDVGGHVDNDDNAPFIQEAIDEIPELIVPEGTFHSSEIVIPGNRTLRGLNANCILKELGSMDEEAWFIKNANVDETSAARLDANIWVKNLTIDGSLRTWTPWLSKLDKTPITDPEADYVPITGALGSGLTPTIFGAVTIVGGIITNIAVSVPGSNFGGHPVYPYLDATVGLEIFGDGEDCSAHGRIVGGQLTSVNIDDGGRNYTVVTGIRERGGYADIHLLADPSVNRRNPNYNSLGYAVMMRKVDGGGVSGVTLVDHGNAGIVDLGCKNFQIVDNNLVRIGKVDQDAYCIWSRSYKSPDSGHVAYAPSDNVYIARNSGTDLRRMFVNFSPAQGGICEDNELNGGQEAGIRVSEWLAYNGGRGIIRNNKLRNIIGNDIEGNGISCKGGSKHLEISGNTIQNCGGLALSISGVKHLHVHHNRIKDIGVNVPYPYGPFSEAYDFGQGTEALAGMPRPYTTIRVIDIGTQFGIGNDNVKIEDNTFLEARAAGDHPSLIIKCVRSGGAKLSKNIAIRRNFIDIDFGAMDFIDRSDTLVFRDEEDLAVYENVPYELIGSGSGLGRHPIYVPASEMKTRITQGASAYTAELPTSKVNVSGWSYADDVSIVRHVQFETRIPANWDGSDITAQFDWLAPAGSANDGVVWSIQAAIRNDGDALDQDYGTGVVVPDLLIAANRLQRTSESPEFTPSGTLTPGGRGFFQIDRKVASADDFLAGAAVLLGCTLWFNINKPTEG